MLQKRKRTAQPLDGLRDNGKIMTELFSYSLLWWFATGMVVLVGSNYTVSRRLVRWHSVRFPPFIDAPFRRIYLTLSGRRHTIPQLSVSTSCSTCSRSKIRLPTRRPSQYLPS